MYKLIVATCITLCAYFMFPYANCNANTLTPQFSIGPPSGEHFSDVVADSQGNIFIGSYFSIYKYSKNGNYIKSINLWETYSVIASGLGIDANGNVYAAALGHILKFSSNLDLLLDIGGEVGFGDGQFSANDVAVDSHGNIFVADDNSYRIQKFDSNGRFLSKWGRYGTGNGEFINIKTLSVDNSDNIVALDGDSDTSTIKIFSNNGSFIRSWNKGISPRDPNLISSLESNGAAAAPNGMVLAIGGSFLYKFSSIGTPLALNLSSLLTGAPDDIFIDKRGFIYVADSKVHVYTWGVQGGVVPLPSKVQIGPVNSLLLL